jgi:ABC-2 type transport system permease protein
MLKRIYEGIVDICYVWREEMKQVFKDEGVIIFFFLVPLAYPLLYSWIYNNEAVHDVPVVVVDDSHSALSRKFIRMCDASPDVKIACHAQDIDEAKSLISRQIVKGIYYFPPDFDNRINRLEQATVSVYCDMSLMLAYKAVYQTAQLVSMEMGKDIKLKLAAHYSAHEESVASKPLDYDDVAIFNPAGGYGTAILPGVLILILQQTLALGIGLSAGTTREKSRYGWLIPVSRHYHCPMRIVWGKTLCYFMIYAVMGFWLTIAVPHIFHFLQLASWQSIMALLLPYILACIFFGMTVSCMVKYRENVMLLMVFVSVPLLFMTGISWPQSNIPAFWQGVSWIFPSTFAARAYVRLNSMGASLSDVYLEYSILWLHTIVYFTLACLVYRYQTQQARKDVHRRLEYKKQQANDGVLSL